MEGMAPSFGIGDDGHTFMLKKRVELQGDYPLFSCADVEPLSHASCPGGISGLTKCQAIEKGYALLFLKVRSSAILG
jgi:hypothetical protein